MKDVIIQDIKKRLYENNLELEKSNIMDCASSVLELNDFVSYYIINNKAIIFTVNDTTYTINYNNREIFTENISNIFNW